MFDFNGKSAIVTGGVQGVGFETAKLLVKHGADVMIVDWNEDGLSEAQNLLSEYGRSVLAFHCDISQEEKVNEAVRYANEEFGKVDILINNAAIFRQDRCLFEESCSEYWKKKIDINILGTMYFTKAVINDMLKNGYGKIVNVASVAGVYGIDTLVDYSMTKGAVISFTKALAKEVTERGVYVNAVSPGGISKDMVTPYALSYRNHPGTFEETANVVVFLASEASNHVSGANFMVDGCRKKM